MLKMDEELGSRKLEAKMILQIHDELVLEVSEKEETVVRQLLKTTMENVMELDVPLVVNLASSKNLAKI